MSADEPAFPPAMQTGDPALHNGLTKREYEMIAYRAAALTGSIAARMGTSGSFDGDQVIREANEFAKRMYAVAHPEEDTDK